MKIQEKPDYLIFADSAKSGECANFPDVSRGWGVTIDQTASKPPLEWMNGAFNRVDKNMMYLLQQGVPEWCENVTYPANAIIKYNGVLYTATVKNDNAIPTTSDKWKKTNSEIADASLTNKGVVQLNSATDSTIESQAATPKAVHDTFEYVRFTDQKAQSAFDHANAAHNRIDPIVDKFQPSGFETRMYSQDKRFYQLVRDDGLVGMYSLVKNDFSWFINHDGWIGGFIEAPRVGGLDQFVRDRTPPVGVPLPWPQVYPPAGYFECNGSTFNRDHFPKLAAAYPHGFLPDLRGEFIRGWDNARGIDPYRVILSLQEDAIRNITGEFSVAYRDRQNLTQPPGGAFSEIARFNSTLKIGDSDDWGRVYSFDASRVVPVSHDNHPRNVAFMYIVKAE